MLSRNEQDTRHKLYMWHNIFAGIHILVSIILLCLACFCASRSSMKLGSDNLSIITYLSYNTSAFLVNKLQLIQGVINHHPLHLKKKKKLIVVRISQIEPVSCSINAIKFIARKLSVCYCSDLYCDITLHLATTIDLQSILTLALCEISPWSYEPNVFIGQICNGTQLPA